jgi:hypothetical protein
MALFSSFQDNQSFFHGPVCISKMAILSELHILDLRIFMFSYHLKLNTV